MTRVYQMLVLAAACLLQIGCNSGSTGPPLDALSVTVTPTHYIDSANLANQSFRRVRRFAEAGDRVDLVIEVQQLKGGFKRCGNPLIRGPVGDVLAVLEPVEDGAVDVGKRYTSEHGTNTPDKVTLTELVPNEKISFHVELPNGLQIDHTMTVGPSGDGTLVTRNQKIVATPGLFKLMRPIIILGFGMATKKNLKNLKTWIEQGES